VTYQGFDLAHIKTTTRFIAIAIRRAIAQRIKWGRGWRRSGASINA
jgi:hypothetical protein